MEKLPDNIGIRILVVDDNFDAAKMLAMLLRITGNTVHTAHDGVEAFAMAQELRPEIVLLDIGLPKMNGYDVARAIRNEPWGEKVALVAMTGWGMEEDKQRATHAGFDRHMVKPVDAQLLIKLLPEIKKARA